MRNTNTSLRQLRRRHFNRLFALLYSLATLSLLYRHLRAAVTTTNFLPPLLLFIADAVLAYMWSTTQSFRINPVVRNESPENLHRKEFPNIDIFICTADPYREPPMVAVNTALSVMAYDYPSERLSVYVSDDGGSELTMFALMEAAKFAKYWVRFCKENKIVDRNPEAYFNLDNNSIDLEIKEMYEAMKLKVETAVENRKVTDTYISGQDQRRILSQFSIDGFSRQQHPTVIQVLLNSKIDNDCLDGPVPNLIYVAREKNVTVQHHFKAGALNSLLRVSACMTNSPIILTLDCDMFSNDPSTISKAVYHISDQPEIGFVQFPQRFRGINKTDIYGCEHKRLFRLNPLGMDGLNGPSYVGTGCFFSRRVFFGGPSSYIKPENLVLDPNSIVDGSIDHPDVLDRARFMVQSDYETNTLWGYKIGFRYGSVVEDYYTGYHLQCEGWKTIFCDPIRAAFLGDIPISLNDALNQTQRWAVGLLEVGFSKFSPITFGIKSMGVVMGQCYAHYAFWAIWCVPVTIYAFLPSLALLRGISIFPKVNDPWFFMYAFLFLGAYGQDCFDFISKEGTMQQWWSDQRMWLIRSLSSYLFGSIEYATKRLGFASHTFNITSKVEDEDKRKRYDQGMFEFEVSSPLFVPMVVASILNLVAFIWGLGRGDGDLLLQTMVAGFAVVNAVPIYEAMVWRGDGGKISNKTMGTSFLVVGFLFGVACVLG